MERHGANGGDRAGRKLPTAQGYHQGIPVLKAGDRAGHRHNWVPRTTRAEGRGCVAGVSVRLARATKLFGCPQGTGNEGRAMGADWLPETAEFILLVCTSQAFTDTV